MVTNKVNVFISKISTYILSVVACGSLQVVHLPFGGHSPSNKKNDVVLVTYLV